MTYTDTSDLELTTLGVVALTRSGEPILVRRRKELGLLAYLARRSPRPTSRARLASMLWPDADETRSRRSLRQALSDIRAVLGDRVIADQDSVRLGSGLRLDVAEFERDVTMERWSEALGRWHGPFLEGLEELGDEQWRTWIEGERVDLSRKLATCFRQAVTTSTASGSVESSIGLATRWAEQFPHDEEAAAALIGALLKGRRQTEAEGRFAIFANRLRTDLATEPSARLAALVAASKQPRQPGIRGLLTPDFVGRDQVMADLDGAWKSAQTGAGVGCLVTVEGEEGIGKSRLLAEWRRRRERDDKRLVVVDVRARQGAELAKAVAAALAKAPGAAAVPPAILGSLAAEVSEIAERFEPRRDPSPAVPFGERLRRLLAEVAAEQPTIVLVDDAPLAGDRDTEALSVALCPPPPGSLVILAGRREHGASRGLLAALGPSSTRLALGPLSPSETTRLTASMAPFAESALARVVDRVHRQSGGNPGLTVELVNTLAEHGAIAPSADGQWDVVGTLDAAPVPSGVREVMTARLGALSSEARALVDAAAVLGAASGAVLESTSGLDPGAYQGALASALSHRIIRVTGNDGRYAFTSEANRQAAYDLMAPSRRAELHRRSARALGRERGSTQDIAHHRRLGGHRAPSRRWLGVGLVAVVLAVVAGLAWRASRRAFVAPASGVLFADIHNETADSTLSRSLYSAALVSLQQSHRFWVFGRSQFGAVLSRMGRPDTVVSGQLAAEVAARENIPVVAQLTVAEVGARYLLSGQLIDARTGRDLRGFRRPPTDRAELLSTLEALASDLRRALGDLESSVRPRDSLPPVSTGSLEALRSFAEGEAAWNRGDWVRARDNWLRAAEIDSSFAMAYLSLAAFSRRMANNPAGAAEHLGSARRFASRLTERERLRLAFEADMLAGDLTGATSTARTVADRFPSPTTLFTLATTLLQAGRCAEAVGVLRRTLTLAPNHTNAWINLATCHNISGALDSALAAYAAAERTDSTVLVRDNLNHEWGQVFLKAGRPAAAESAFRRVLDQPDPARRSRGYRSLGYLAMYRGRYREAVGYLDQAIQLSRGAGQSVSTVRNLTIGAHAALSAGDTSAALVRLDAAADLLNAQSFEGAYYTHVATGYLRAGRPTVARSLLARLRARLDQGTPIDSAHHRQLEARMALEDQNPRQALAILSQLDPPGFSTSVPSVLRGEAYDALGRADSALAAFLAAREIWNWGFEGQEEWVRLPLRIGLVAEALRDSGLARSAYSELIDRWLLADMPLPELATARRRLGPLQTNRR